MAKDFICGSCKKKNQIIKLVPFKIYEGYELYMCPTEKCTFPLAKGEIEKYVIKSRSDGKNAKDLPRVSDVKDLISLLSKTHSGINRHYDQHRKTHLQDELPNDTDILVCDVSKTSVCTETRSSPLFTTTTSEACISSAPKTLPVAYHLSSPLTNHLKSGVEESKAIKTLNLEKGNSLKLYSCDNRLQDCNSGDIKMLTIDAPLDISANNYSENGVDTNKLVKDLSIDAFKFSRKEIRQRKSDSPKSVIIQSVNNEVSNHKNSSNDKLEFSYSSGSDTSPAVNHSVQSVSDDSEKYIERKELFKEENVEIDSCQTEIKQTKLHSPQSKVIKSGINKMLKPFGSDKFQSCNSVTTSDVSVDAVLHKSFEGYLSKWITESEVTKDHCVNDIKISLNEFKDKNDTPLGNSNAEPENNVMYNNQYCAPSITNEKLPAEEYPNLSCNLKVVKQDLIKSEIVQNGSAQNEDKCVQFGSHNKGHNQTKNDGAMEKQSFLNGKMHVFSLNIYDASPSVDKMGLSVADSSKSDVDGNEWAGIQHICEADSTHRESMDIDHHSLPPKIIQSGDKEILKQFRSTDLLLDNNSFDTQIPSAVCQEVALADKLGKNKEEMKMPKTPNFLEDNLYLCKIKHCQSSSLEKGNIFKQNEAMGLQISPNGILEVCDATDLETPHIPRMLGTSVGENLKESEIVKGEKVKEVFSKNVMNEEHSIKSSSHCYSDAVQKQSKQAIDHSPNKGCLKTASEFMDKKTDVLCSNATKCSFPIWKNEYALCWLDATLSLLVHCNCLKDYFKSKSSITCHLKLVFTAYCDSFHALNSAGYESKSSSTIADLLYTEAYEKLETVREKLFNFIQPELQCQKGEEESPIFALPIILKENDFINSLFLMDFSWKLKCQNCGHCKTTSNMKSIITIPSTHSNFSFHEPYFLRSCFNCQAPNQRMYLQLSYLPDVMLFHFVDGLPHADIAKYDIMHLKEIHRVTGIIQYVVGRRHFVTWVRNYRDGSWLCCDDLQTSLPQFVYDQPEVPPSEIHVLMCEKDSMQNLSSMEAQKCNLLQDAHTGSDVGSCADHPVFNDNYNFSPQKGQKTSHTYLCNEKNEKLSESHISGADTTLSDDFDNWHLHKISANESPPIFENYSQNSFHSKNCTVYESLISNHSENHWSNLVKRVKPVYELLHKNCCNDNLHYNKKVKNKIVISSNFVEKEPTVNENILNVINSTEEEPVGDIGKTSVDINNSGKEWIDINNIEKDSDYVLGNVEKVSVNTLKDVEQKQIGFYSFEEDNASHKKCSFENDKNDNANILNNNSVSFKIIPYVSPLKLDEYTSNSKVVEGSGLCFTPNNLHTFPERNLFVANIGKKNLDFSDDSIPFYSKKENIFEINPVTSTEKPFNYVLKSPNSQLKNIALFDMNTLQNECARKDSEFSVTLLMQKVETCSPNESNNVKERFFEEHRNIDNDFHENFVSEACAKENDLFNIDNVLETSCSSPIYESCEQKVKNKEDSVTPSKTTELPQLLNSHDSEENVLSNFGNNFASDSKIANILHTVNEDMPDSLCPTDADKQISFCMRGNEDVQHSSLQYKGITATFTFVPDINVTSCDSRMCRVVHPVTNKVESNIFEVSEDSCSSTFSNEDPVEFMRKNGSKLMKTKKCDYSCPLHNILVNKHEKTDYSGRNFVIGKFEVETGSKQESKKNINISDNHLSKTKNCILQNATVNDRMQPVMCTKPKILCRCCIEKFSKILEILISRKESQKLHRCSSKDNICNVCNKSKCSENDNNFILSPDVFINSLEFIPSRNNLTTDQQLLSLSNMKKLIEKLSCFTCKDLQQINVCPAENPILTTNDEFILKFLNLMLLSQIICEQNADNCCSGCSATTLSFSANSQRVNENIRVKEAFLNHNSGSLITLKKYKATDCKINAVDTDQKENSLKHNSFSDDGSIIGSSDDDLEPNNCKFCIHIKNGENRKATFIKNRKLKKKDSLIKPKEQIKISSYENNQSNRSKDVTSTEMAVIGKSEKFTEKRCIRQVNSQKRKFKSRSFKENENHIHSDQSSDITSDDKGQKKFFPTRPVEPLNLGRATLLQSQMHSEVSSKICDSSIKNVQSQVILSDLIETSHDHTYSSPSNRKQNICDKLDGQVKYGHKKFGPKRTGKFCMSTQSSNDLIKSNKPSHILSKRKIDALGKDGSHISEQVVFANEKISDLQEIAEANTLDLGLIVNESTDSETEKSALKNFSSKETTEVVKPLRKKARFPAKMLPSDKKTVHKRVKLIPEQLSSSKEISKSQVITKDSDVLNLGTVHNVENICNNLQKEVVNSIDDLDMDIINAESIHDEMDTQPIPLVANSYKEIGTHTDSDQTTLSEDADSLVTTASEIIPLKIPCVPVNKEVTNKYPYSQFMKTISECEANVSQSKISPESCSLYKTQSKLAQNQLLTAKHPLSSAFSKQSTPAKKINGNHVSRLNTLSNTRITKSDLSLNFDAPILLPRIPTRECK